MNCTIHSQLFEYQIIRIIRSNSDLSKYHYKLQLKYYLLNTHRSFARKEDTRTRNRVNFNFCFQFESFLCHLEIIYNMKQKIIIDKSFCSMQNNMVFSFSVLEMFELFLAWKSLKEFLRICVLINIRQDVNFQVFLEHAQLAFLIN